MKRYKVSEILKMLTKDGWYIDRQKGSHRQLKHPSKQGACDSKRQTFRHIGPVSSEQHLETGRVEMTSCFTSQVKL